MTRVEQPQAGRYASGMNVGVAELKRRLGHYLRLIRKGERVIVCLRGIPVAELRATKRPRKRRDPDLDAMERLIAEGAMTRGRFPVRRRPFRPIRTRGKKLVSEMIIEDRGP